MINYYSLSKSAQAAPTAPPKPKTPPAPSKPRPAEPEFDPFQIPKIDPSEQPRPKNKLKKKKLFFDKI